MNIKSLARWAKNFIKGEFEPYAKKIAGGMAPSLVREQPWYKRSPLSYMGLGISEKELPSMVEELGGGVTTKAPDPMTEYKQLLGQGANLALYAGGLGKTPAMLAKPGLKQMMKAGAKIGTKYGALGGVFRGVGEQEETDVPDLLYRAVLGGGLGAVTGAGAGAASRGLQVAGKGLLKGIRGYQALTPAEKQAGFAKIPGQVELPGMPKAPAQASKVELATPKAEGGWTRFAKGTYARLQNMGQRGGQLVAKTKRAFQNTDLEVAQDDAAISQIEKGFSQLEKDNLRNTLRGLEQPINTKVAQAHLIMSSKYRQIASGAMNVKLEKRLPTGEQVPFAPIENFNPIIYASDQFKNQKVRNEVLQAMVENNIAKDLSEANTLLLSRETNLTKASHLERPRMFEPEQIPHLKWEKDPFRAYRIYTQEARQRINVAKEFGPNNEVAEDIINQMGQEGHDVGVTRELFDTIMGTGGKPMGKLASTVSALSSFRLGLAAIPNWSQRHINNLITYGVRPWLKTMVSMKLSPYQSAKFGREAGAALEETQRQIMSAAGVSEQGLIGKAAGKFLRATRFAPAEVMNRIFSSNVGKFFAKQKFDNLLANPNNKYAQEALTDLGINWQKSLKVGKLSSNELVRAGNAAWKKTQFTYKPGEIPAWVSREPMYKLMWQFKTYAYNQANIIGEQIFKKGSLQERTQKFILLVTAFPALGEVVGTLRDKISGKPRQNIVNFALTNRSAKKAIQRYINAFTWVGGLGIVTDAISSAKYGKAGMLGYAAGPAIGSAADWIEAIVRGGPSMVRKGIRDIPVVGPGLQRRLVPSQNQEQQRSDLMYELMQQGQRPQGFRPTTQGMRGYQERTERPIGESIKRWLYGAENVKKKKSKALDLIPSGL